VESVEVPAYRQGERQEAEYRPPGPGPGVNSRKMAFVAITLAIGLGSIAIINNWY